MKNFYSQSYFFARLKLLRVIFINPLPAENKQN